MPPNEFQVSLETIDRERVLSGIIAERTSQMMGLNADLEHARRTIAERDAQIAAMADEIAKLKQQ